MILRKIYWVIWYLLKSLVLHRESNILFKITLYKNV